MDFEEVCPVCHDPPEDNIVYTPCGHRFCETCIARWFGARKQHSCPMCRAMVRAADCVVEVAAPLVASNHALVLRELVCLLRENSAVCPRHIAAVCEYSFQHTVLKAPGCVAKEDGVTVAKVQTWCVEVASYLCGGEPLDTRIDFLVAIVSDEVASEAMRSLQRLWLHLDWPCWFNSPQGSVGDEGDASIRASVDYIVRLACGPGRVDVGYLDTLTPTTLRRRISEELTGRPGALGEDKKALIAQACTDALREHAMQGAVKPQ